MKIAAIATAAAASLVAYSLARVSLLDQERIEILERDLDRSRNVVKYFADKLESSGVTHDEYDRIVLNQFMS